MNGPDHIGQRILARRDAFTAARDLYITFLSERVVYPQIPAPPPRTSAYSRERPIFVQYVNPEILGCYGHDVAGKRADRILVNAERATRISVLLTDRFLVFPASYIFEVPWFHVFLRAVEPLVHAGIIQYTAPVPGLAAYQEAKVSEYRNDEDNPYACADTLRSSVTPHLVWKPRRSTSTAMDIASLWATATGGDGELRPMVRTLSKRWRRPYGRLEKVISETPERLAGQAFIKRFVERILPLELTAAESNDLALFLSRAYLHSYILGLDASIVTDLPIGDLSCAIDATAPQMRGRLLSAQRLDLALRWLSLHDFIYRSADWTDLIQLRSSAEFGAITLALYGSRSPTTLRLAMIKARASAHFKHPVTTRAEAMSNIALAGGEVMRILDLEKSHLA